MELFSETELVKKSGWCKACVKDYNKSYYQEIKLDPIRYRQLLNLKGLINKRYEERNPEKKKKCAERIRREKGQRPLKTRFMILEKYNFKCFYCGRSSQEVALQIDHVLPRSKGGTDEIENLVSACVDCNVGKADVLLKAN